MTNKQIDLKTILEQNNQLENEKMELLEEIENYRNELSELYKMINSLKHSYIQEQKQSELNLDNDTIKIKDRNKRLEQENKYIQARLSAYKNSKLGKITTWYWNYRK